MQQYRKYGQALIVTAVAIAAVAVAALIYGVIQLVEVGRSFDWNFAVLGTWDEGELSLGPPGIMLVTALVGAIVLGAVSNFIKSLIESGLMLANRNALSQKEQGFSSDFK